MLGPHFRKLTMAGYSMSGSHLWIPWTFSNVCCYCSGQAEVRRNEITYMLDSNYISLGHWNWGRVDTMWAIYDTWCTVIHSLGEYSGSWLLKWRIYLGMGQHRQGCFKYIANQMARGTISIHTLWLLLGQTEHLWSYPYCSDADSLSWPLSERTKKIFFITFHIPRN